MKTKIINILVLLALIFIGILLFKYLTYRNLINPYDSKKDYNYGIDQKYIADVDIKKGRLQIPDSSNSSYSTFLKLNIKSTLFGNWTRPSVNIKSENLSLVEYYEDGATGDRYLNLTPFTNHKNKTIELTGNKIVIDNQSTELYSFKNIDLNGLKILIIGTHPDDAEIAAFGLYSTYAKNSFVLNIKSGESGPFKYDEIYSDTIAHYRKKGQLRTWNSITVPLLGGIKTNNALNLGYFSELRKKKDKNPENLVSTFTRSMDINQYRKQNFSSLKDSLVPGSNWSSLIQNLEIVLKHVKPDIIVTPYPAIDEHPEHKYTTIALIEALKNSKITTGELFLYSNHYVLNEHYPFGKTGNNVPLPPNFNNDIYFDKIYSHTLSAMEQNDKLFALEAMHDLRPDTEWRFGKKAVKKALNDWKTEILGGRSDNSYFERAVRTSELFFTVPIHQIYNDTVFQKLINGNNNGFTNDPSKIN